MSPSEVWSRVGDQLYLLRLRVKHRQPPAEPPAEPPGSDRKPEFNIGEFTLDTAAIANDYPLLLEGSLSYGGGDWQFDEGSEVWHVEHTTLRPWPQTFFNAIDYRPGNPVGDVRRSWEPARLQQLVALAVRARDLNLDEREANSALALSMIERQLTSWWTHNPVLHGIHYVSAMECGLRCIAVTHAASLLESRGRLSATVRAIVLSILSQHADFIRKRISTHSSAGNHTLAECAGLIYCSLILQDRDQSSRDEAFATNLFTHELNRQVNADGGGIEQATWYHRFNIELAECVAEALRANGRAVPAQLLGAIERGGRFLNAVDATGAGFVRLGDADDGYALSPYYVGRWRAFSSDNSIQHFDRSGVSCIRMHGFKVIVQYGSLGMAPAYGHGHADALSILASLDNREMLCDSGTGAYAGESAAQRAVFRSCAAHNTVQVGDSDFAKIVSPFMWSHPYQCVLHHQQTSDDQVELWMSLTVRADHSFTVSRYVRVDAQGLHVADRVVPETPATVTQRWHVPVELTSLASDTGCIALGDTNVTIELASSEVNAVGQAIEQRSVKYGELESVTTLSNKATVTDTGWLFMRMAYNADEAPLSGYDALSTRAMEYFQ